MALPATAAEAQRRAEGRQGRQSESRQLAEWMLLTSQQVDRTRGSERIDVRAARGSVKAVRLIARDNGIGLRRVQITYADGRVHVEDRAIDMNPNDRTRPMDESGTERFVDEVELTIRPERVPRGVDRNVTIEIWGLQTTAGAKSERPSSGPVASSPVTAAARPDVADAGRPGPQPMPAPPVPSVVGTPPPSLPAAATAPPAETPAPAPPETAASSATGERSAAAPRQAPPAPMIVAPPPVPPPAPATPHEPAAAALDTDPSTAPSAIPSAAPAPPLSVAVPSPVAPPAPQPPSPVVAGPPGTAPPLPPPRGPQRAPDRVAAAPKLPVPAIAPPGDPPAEGIFIGRRTLEQQAGSEVVPIGLEVGKLSRVRLRVLDDAARVTQAKIIYASGAPEIVNLEADFVPAARTPWLAVAANRGVRSVEIAFVRRGNSRTATTIEVYGDPADGYLDPGGEGARLDRYGGWIPLGAATAALKAGLDHLDFALRGNKGGFRKLRVDAKERAITLREVRVVYATGEDEVVTIDSSRQRIAAGASFGPIDLRGSTRPIKSIVLKTRARFLESEARGKDAAIIEVWGHH